MIFLKAILSALGIRGCIAAAAILAGILLAVALKMERNAKLRAQAKAQVAEQNAKIFNEGYLKLYQEREEIKAKADKTRRRLNELKQKGDLGGLSDFYNRPNGVRLPKASGGGTNPPARYYDSSDPKIKYKTAP